MNRFASLVIALPLLAPPILSAQTPLTAQIAQASMRIGQLDLLQASALDKARAWRSLAALEQDAALYTKSAASFAEAIQLFRGAPNSTLELAEAIDGRGTVEMQTGQFSASETSLSQARTMRLDMKDSLGVARSDVHLANLYLGEHNYEQAHALATEALASFDHDPHADTLDKSSAMIAIGLALCKQNHSGDALPVLENLVALSRRNYPDDSVPVAFSVYLLGYAQQKNGNFPLAEANIKRGIEGMDKSMGWGHPIFVEALSQYAILLRETGRAAEAQQVDARTAQLRNSAHQGAAINLAVLP